MRVDIYRRPEPEHKLSYLVVPESRVLPEEVTNVVLHESQKFANAAAWKFVRKDSTGLITGSYTVGDQAEKSS